MELQISIQNLEIPMEDTKKRSLAITKIFKPNLVTMNTRPENQDPILHLTKTEILIQIFLETMRPETSIPNLEILILLLGIEDTKPKIPIRILTITDTDIEIRIPIVVTMNTKAEVLIPILDITGTKLEIQIINPVITGSKTGIFIPNRDKTDTKHIELKFQY